MVQEVQSVEVPAMHKQTSYTDEKNSVDSELGGIPAEEEALIDDHDAYVTPSSL